MEGRHNAWRLTVTGEDFEAAIRHGTRILGAERDTRPAGSGNARPAGAVDRAWRPLGKSVGKSRRPVCTP